MKPKPMADKFWRQVDFSDGAGCWQWRGSIGRHGYGRISHGRGARFLVHRVAWRLIHGTIPAGMSVLHRCDNPPCVRPDHLFLGTQTDNLEDAMKKGRMPILAGLGRRVRGSSHHNSVLTEEGVRAIRAAHGAGHRPKILAAVHGVSAMTVWRVVTRRAWAHVR